MVDEAQTFELFRFADPVQSVAVEVRCVAPLTMGDERYYAAEIVLESGFVNGRVGLQVSLGDLDDWERCLVGQAPWLRPRLGQWLVLHPSSA
ncbi:DUF5959 family protein [Streptomyces sp. NPDC002088]|uniref:DUF5959 family protein n=1 Tax=Streptomyces sp. NPDC002088 TaxID=3154665 RepID=UPI003324077E